MWEQILNIAISNGIFAALFVALLVYELKDSRSREKKYQSTIDGLSRKLVIVEEISEDVNEIKNIVIFNKKRKKENETIEDKVKII